ncbi:DUF2059 domain-containing protein [Dyella mobilis]|uniref:DUF2059 domain-containing protein n=1 Tax=Dyella mobilis TaxID=1849582 RepID=A0ABS2KHW4_9GAMM|nr:DUF2059 domain-containing protein [Dyella mobilis]MBM7130761.1 DUF2059 domain-containing protein [Dyella mobilis]GLQ97386.1 hypothetical protein GCM10007863_18060 [Dyella mobilis]
MSAGKWVLGLGVCLALAGVPAMAAQPSEAQVRQLMQVMDVPGQFTVMNNQMAAMMSQQLPCVPASYWQTYIDKNGVAQLETAMIPAYQHHFTADEVDGLIKFYKSTLGQKLVAQMPATMAEAAQAGQQWGRQRTSDMFSELQKQGKLDAQGRCPATSSDGGSAQPSPAPGAGSGQ